MHLSLHEGKNIVSMSCQFLHLNIADLSFTQISVREFLEVAKTRQISGFSPRFIKSIRENCGVRIAQPQCGAYPVTRLTVRG